ncbi:MAG TPA: hypothetical protein DIS88_09035 [Prevotella sp.]|nr:hypothetical protein [Prevotella sp.]
MNRKTFVLLLLVLIVLLASVEILARKVFGFCDALLYEPSNRYEYIQQPNQDHYRFFAHIHYNAYSQRSDAPNPHRRIILGLGDSVLFGGTMLDQDSIATSLFSKETGMQMLNIACGSWGPDNCAAYLKEKGMFGAKAMFLVVSSHDAHDNMSFQPVVGIYPNYPDKQYSFALWEIIDRYVRHRVSSLFHSKKLLDPDAQVADGQTNEKVARKAISFNPGFEQLRLMADSCHIPLIVYLHGEVGEVEERKFNEMGKEILAWASAHRVKLVNGIQYGETKDMYRDAIHFNNKGQRHLADVMERVFKSWERN